MDITLEDIEQDVYPDDVQEITESQAQLAKLLDTLTILKDFQGQMNPEKGICRDEVKSLVTQCQVGLDERFPLESFTLLPSQQGYQVATEAIFKRAGQVISEFFKGLTALFLKGVAWVVKTVKALFTRETKVKATVAKIQAVDRANTEAEAVTRTIRDTEGPLHSDEKLKEYRERLERAKAAYADTYNGLAEAMLTEKGFIGQIRFLGLKLPELLFHVEKNLDAMRAAFETLGDKVRFTGQLNTMLELKIEPTWFHNKGGEIPELAEAANAPTIGDYMRQLEELIRRLDTEKPHGQADWQIAAKVIMNPDTGFADPFVTMKEHLVTEAEALEKRVIGLSAPATLDRVMGAQPQLRALYDRVVEQMTDEFYAVLRFFDVAVLVTQTQSRLASAVWNLEVTSYELRLAEAQQTQDASIIERMNEIQKSLREKTSLWSK